MNADDPLFPKFDYRLDESDPDVLVLERQDGTFVAAFSARGGHEGRHCRSRKSGLPWVDRGARGLVELPRREQETDREERLESRWRRSLARSGRGTSPSVPTGSSYRSQRLLGSGCVGALGRSQRSRPRIGSVSCSLKYVEKMNSPKFTVASAPSGATPSILQQHIGTPAASKSGD